MYDSSRKGAGTRFSEQVGGYSLEQRLRFATAAALVRCDMHCSISLWISIIEPSPPWAAVPQARREQIEEDHDHLLAIVS